MVAGSCRSEYAPGGSRFPVEALLRANDNFLARGSEIRVYTIRMSIGIEAGALMRRGEALSEGVRTLDNWLLRVFEV